jgi:hypothetical protein
MTHDLEKRTYIVINESLHAAVIAHHWYVDYSNVNNTTRIFLVPHPEGVNEDVYINLARANFSIDEVLRNGDVEEAPGFAEFFQGENSSLIINATNSDPQKYYELYLSWRPANFTINDSTTISANLACVNGSLLSLRLDLVNETGSFYHYNLTSSLSTSVGQTVIDSTSKDMYDKHLLLLNRSGWRVSAMNLVMTLNHTTSAKVELDALSYSTDGGKTSNPLPITLKNSPNCTATVYVGESFNLKNLPVGIVTWCIPIIAALYAYRLVRRVKIENINDK